MKSLQKFGRINWLRFGVRNRVIRFFCMPHEREFEIDYYGFKYLGNLNNYLDWSVYFFGAYEKTYLYLFRSLVEKIEKPVFVDVGANVGTHSLFMSKYCDKVISFEPDLSVGEKITEKLEINRINNVEYYPVGLGEEKKWIPFYAASTINTATGSFLKEFNDSNVCVGEKQVVNGDQFLEEIGISRIDLIKIDVEGFEKSVLKGLQKTLSKMRPIVFMEWSKHAKDTFSSIEEMVDLFPQYTFYKVLDTQHILFFFCKEEVILDDFYFDNAGRNIIMIPDERIGSMNAIKKVLHRREDLS